MLVRVHSWALFFFPTKGRLLHTFFFAEPNQNWCTVRVNVPNHAVTCPGSDFALKVKVLKKAADMAEKEKTTVRIPIDTLNHTRGEAKNFGVYAVPGLETHVFVVPFTDCCFKIF